MTEQGNSTNLSVAFAGKSVQQIVGFCGDGKLTNESECSAEFRDYLSNQNEATLSEHAGYCLDNAFEKSGYVLQDIVNEMGRRIGYEVEDGLYSGKKNDIGFDGIWKNGNEWVVVEVKTTDAYRINLDTIMRYATKLEKKFADQEISLSALIVAGRQDTGDMEAQIRGSKHAWSVRLISVDALTKLVFLNIELDDKDFGYKVNKILKPFEYTRVDEIVDLIFETQKETEKNITGENEAGIGESVRSSDFTPKKAVEAKKEEIVEKFFGKLGLGFEKRSRTNFESGDGKIGVCCVVSKRYDRNYQPYWYALRPNAVEFLKQYKEGYFILGCMDRSEAFCIPLDIVLENIDNLNITENEDRFYWHITLILDDGNLKWMFTKIGKKIDLSPYILNI